MFAPGPGFHLLALAMGAFIRPVSSTEDGVPEINICNIHDGSAAFGQPEQRPQDGLWQNKCALDVLLGHPRDCLVLPLCTCGVTWLPAAFQMSILLLSLRLCFLSWGFCVCSPPPAVGPLLFGEASFLSHA